jgi:hypothetical protein
MIVFGLVLLILAVIAIAYVWLATAGMTPISIDYGVLNVELTPLWFFFAGGIVLAIATSGLWLMGVGAKTSARRAREVRELRRQAKESDRHAERERDRAALGTVQDHDRATARADGPPTGRAGAGRPGTAAASSSGDRQTTGTDATRDGSAGDTGASAPRTSRPTDGQQPILPRPGRDERPGR